MGLTFRDIKGSSLTIEEADGNFRYLTGSHEISGSLTISGSLLPSSISSTLGSADSPWKEIFVSGSTITFVGSSSAHTASISMTPDLKINSSFTGSFSGDGSRLVNVRNSNVDGAPYQYGETGDGPIEPVLGSNDSTSNYATIGGGQLNSITSSFCNFVETGSEYSFIGGGRKNQITGSTGATIISSGKSIIENNNKYSHIIGGYGNKIQNCSCVDNNYPIDLQFPLVIEGTEIITSSGSRGMNHIVGGLANSMSGSNASFIYGMGNRLLGSWHSMIEGCFNCIRNESHPTGSQQFNCVSADPVYNQFAPPGYNYKRIGNRIGGGSYNSCILSIGSTLSNKFLDQGSSIMNSIQSHITNAGGTHIGDSLAVNITTYSTQNWPGSGSNLDRSAIQNSQWSGIQAQYFGNYISNWSLSNLQFPNNVISHGKHAHIRNGTTSHIISSYGGKIHRSRDSRMIGGGVNRIFDDISSQIIGANFSCIIGYENLSLNDAIVLGPYGLDQRSGHANYIFGGSSHLIQGRWQQRNLIVGGSWNDIVGYRNDTATIISGLYNEISSSKFSIISNGYYSCIKGNDSSYVYGCGFNQILTSCCSNIDVSVEGGHNSIIGSIHSLATSSRHSAIIGGQYNTMSHDDSFIIGSCLTSSYNCTTHVNNIFISGGLRDSSGDLGSSTQILSSTGTGTNWISLGAATNTTYILEVASGLGDDNAIITLSGSDETEDNVNIIGGTGINVSVSGDDITITNDYALNLVAGPGIVINENGNNTEISASVNPDNTSSFYYSSSVVLNTITFFQGDGTTETVTVDTGSGGGGGGDDFHHVYQSGSTGNNIEAILGSHINSGSYATIGGGILNSIHNSGDCSFIGAGQSNITTGSNSFIGAGYNNCINSCGRCSAIVGGHDNNIFDDDSFIGGGHGNEVAASADGEGWMTIGGGQFNCTGCGGAAVVGGAQNDALGCLSFIGGGFCNINNACYGVIGGGCRNDISSLVCRSSILGGTRNIMSGSFSTILGGDSNCIVNDAIAIVGGISNLGSGACSFIGGGANNCTTDTYSIVIGGSDNRAGGDPYSAILGGRGGCATDEFSVILNGCLNKAFQDYSLIGTGCCNLAEGFYSTVVNGIYNSASGCFSFIGNGSGSISGGDYSFIGSGVKNNITGSSSIIVGGNLNKVSGSLSFIGSGVDNIISSSYSFIGGGCSNCADGQDSVVVGGRDNYASTTRAAVVGGYLNCARGGCSFVGGGYSNDAFGAFSVVAGGYNNSACGICSFIGGGCTQFIHSCQKHAFIGGGRNNCITYFSGYTPVDLNDGNFIPSGRSNCICTTSGNYNTLGGGQNNNILANVANSTIAGGASNIICNTTTFDYGSFIGGGAGNVISGSDTSTIAGGCKNFMDTTSHSFIGGGILNTSSAVCSFIGGGEQNNITSDGEYSFIGGGCCNVANNCYSFVLGCNITTDQDNTTFVNNFHATGSEGSNNVITFANLPTSDPNNVGQLFVTQSDASGNLNGQYVLLVSQG